MSTAFDVAELVARITQLSPDHNGSVGTLARCTGALLFSHKNTRRDAGRLSGTGAPCFFTNTVL
jgi:hypothetical protein